MNAFQLPDYHGNAYMIESEISVDEFPNALYKFCCDYYDKYKGIQNTEIHYDALDEFVNILQGLGFKSRVIKPVLESHMWVWD